MQNVDYGSLLAFVSITGFAIQQGLQLFEPFALLLVRSWPGNLDETLKKKIVMGVLSLGCGFLVASIGKIRLLSMLNASYNNYADIIISALVFSAGTEGANSIQKYIGYVKDSKKLPAVEIAIIPGTLTVAAGRSAKLMCALTSESDTTVEWSLAHGNMGQVTQDGTFTAGHEKGTCIVVVRSLANPAKLGFATITIS